MSTSITCQVFYYYTFKDMLLLASASHMYQYLYHDYFNIFLDYVCQMFVPLVSQVIFPLSSFLEFFVCIYVGLHPINGYRKLLLKSTNRVPIYSVGVFFYTQKQMWTPNNLSFCAMRCHFFKKNRFICQSQCKP